MATLAVVGGQYGSEGKGVIAAHLASQITLAVRTGGPNAGHTLIHQGVKYKMRSVPCAWVNPKTLLILGPGAVIDPETLIREVELLEAAGFRIKHRLVIDEQATIVTEGDKIGEHQDYSGGVGSLVDRIASTGEGVGRARMRRMERYSELWVPARDALPRDYRVEDTLSIVATNSLIGRVMLEGTQGYGLSLNGPKWPYVTSANCTAAQLYADAMLAPSRLDATLVVFRSYPIRVGGNSGPMDGEIDFERLSTRIGVPIEPERTTVTNRVRRIAEWDWELAERAVIANGASSIALTFADYIDPSCAGETSFYNLPSLVRVFIDQLEERLDTPVALIGTGGPGFAVCDRTTSTPLHSGRPRIGKDHDRSRLS